MKNKKINAVLFSMVVTREMYLRFFYEDLSDVLNIKIESKNILDGAKKIIEDNDYWVTVKIYFDQEKTFKKIKWSFFKGLLTRKQL